MLMYLIMGLAAAFNILVIKWKIEHSRYADSALDGAVLLVFAFVFGGTLGGMVIATVGSAIVSLYLLAFPPKFSTAY